MSRNSARPMRARVPVPLELRTRLRALANSMGRFRAARAVHLSWDFMNEYLDDYGVATEQSIAGVRERLDAVEKTAS